MIATHRLTRACQNLQGEPTLVLQPNPSDHQRNLCAVVSKVDDIHGGENSHGDEDAG